jgi:hypothetical protein
MCMHCNPKRTSCRLAAPLRGASDAWVGDDSPESNALRLLLLLGDSGSRGGDSVGDE